MKGAGRPTSDMIRSRPVSRGTTGVSVSSSPAEEEKKKPDEPVPVPVPPSPGDATRGAVGAGESGGTGRGSEAGLRVPSASPATEGAVGLENGVARVDEARPAVRRSMIGAVWKARA
jgi:hypothetical protein